MIISTGATHQTLSYVFTAAAVNASAPAPIGGVVTSSATSNLAPASPTPATTPPDDGAAPAGSISAEEARQNLLDFLENPDTVRLKMMRLDPATITYGPPSQQAAPTPPLVSPPFDSSVPIHVGVKRSDANVGIGVGDPVESYMMLRSIIHQRQAAGQTLNLVEGAGNTPVDPETYLETLRQTAIAAVSAQGAVDKTA
jgi:hypothetical protein